MRDSLGMILSVCCTHDNSNTNDPKVFKVGTENDLGLVYRSYALGSKVEGYLG